MLSIRIRLNPTIAFWSTNQKDLTSYRIKATWQSYLKNPPSSTSNLKEVEPDKDEMSGDVSSKKSKKDEDVSSKVWKRLVPEREEETAKRLIFEWCVWGNLILFPILGLTCRNDFMVKMKSTVKTNKARDLELLWLEGMIN